MRIGRYEVRDEIARGGMGAVLRAWDPERREEVALKLVLDGASAPASRRRRFTTECQAMLRVRHPNVVSLLDQGEHEGVPWLAMELVEGTSLAERLRRGGPLEPREAARITKLLADALRHLHEQGVLHRDVKPANVLVTPEGRTVLTDFGLAKDLQAGPEAGGVSVVGQMLGTPGYLPPEQVFGQVPADARSDVYGLGATLYAMLTARPPYDAPDVAELLAAMHEPPPAPGALREGIDPRLDAICLRCLERDPERRWPSAEALSAALGDWIRGEAPPPARPPWPLLAGGGAVLVLCGLGAVWAALPPPPGPPRAVSPPPVALAPVSTPVGPTSPPDERTDERPALAAAAAAAVESREWAAAAAAWTRYLRLEPDALPALRGRAIARGAQGDALGALEDLDRAVAQAPADPELLVDRSHVRRSTRDLAGARRDLDRAVEIAPRHANVWFVRGQLRQEQGDPAGALADLDRSLELDPDRILALHLRANLREDQGDLPGALRDRQRMAELRPDLPAMWVDVARLHQALGDQDSALTALEEACRADPHSGLALARRGHVKLLRHDWAGAEADLRRARELGGDEPSVVAHHLARALEELGRRDEAREVLDAALRDDPGDADLLAYRGFLRHLSKDLPGAKADLTAALERDPQSLSVWLSRGLVRLDQGDKEGALADTDKALELAPDDPQVWVNHGSILEAMGRTDEALADFSQAIELDEAEFRGWVGRGQLRFRLRQYEAARDDFLRAVPLAPDILRLRTSLGLTRYYTGDKEGARADWEEVSAREPQGPEGDYARLLLRDLFPPAKTE